MKIDFTNFKPGELKQRLLEIAIVDDTAIRQIRLLRSYLRTPLVCKEFQKDLAEWNSSILSEGPIISPHPIELVLESLPPGLKSLLKTTDIDTKIKAFGSREDRANLSGLNRPRFRLQDCFVLDVEYLNSYGLLSPNGPQSGVLVLLNVYSRHALFIIWEIERSPLQAWLTLFFQGPEEGILISRIEIWQSHRSSNSILSNWWMRCPNELESSSKTSHFTKLYLQPGGSFFACSRCLNLNAHRSKDMRRMPLGISMVFVKEDEKSVVTGTTLDQFDHCGDHNGA